MFVAVTVLVSHNQLFQTCRLLSDRLTGMCTTKCQNESLCSAPRPCAYRPIRSEADFDYYRQCEEVCSLHLHELANYDVSLFSAFANLRRIRGTLSITHNKYLYTLDFLSKLELVCLCDAEPCLTFSRLRMSSSKIMSTLSTHAFPRLCSAPHDRPPCPTIRLCSSACLSHAPDLCVMSASPSATQPVPTAPRFD
jgi:hypothetical protein